jgi:4-hydroxybenzoate polyprenyltransferase
MTIITQHFFNYFGCQMVLQFLRLIRWPNLLIITLTMLGVRYGIFASLWNDAVKEMLDRGFLVRGFTLHMSNSNFYLLLFSILCIAAAGNIINDYFDTKTDRLNKPDKVVVGRTIKRRVAMAMHLTLNGLGLITGVYLAFSAGNWKLSGIFVFSILALWFYSTQLKRQLLSGNILISILTALVPITVGLFEFASGAAYDLNVLNLNSLGFGNLLLRKAAFILIGFSVFAFLSNLIREIVKDMEDVEGDIAIGARTLPIVLGETYAKYFVISITIFTIVLLAFVQQYLWLNSIHIIFWYFSIFVQIPLVLLVVKLYSAWTKSQYSFASLLCKIIIVTGVLSMFVYRFAI